MNLFWGSSISSSSTFLENSGEFFNQIIPLSLTSGKCFQCFSKWVVAQVSSYFSLEIIKKGVKPIKKKQSKMETFVTMEKGGSHVWTVVISKHPKNIELVQGPKNEVLPSFSPSLTNLKEKSIFLCSFFRKHPNAPICSRINQLFFFLEQRTPADK